MNPVPLDVVARGRAPAKAPRRLVGMAGGIRRPVVTLSTMMKTTAGRTASATAAKALPSCSAEAVPSIST